MLIAGLSLLTGLAGSLWLHQQKKAESKPYLCVGDWLYYHKNKDKIFVTVTPDLKLYFGDKLEPVTIVEQMPHRLIFLDSMGYQIIFEEKDAQLFFYDETEETSFQLVQA